MKNNLKKDFIWNTVGSLIISITSLIYMMMMSRYCKLSNVGIFSFGFSFACMMVTLASFGGRTYQVTDVKGEIDTSTYIITRYLTVSFSFLLIIIYSFVKDYNYTKRFVIIILCLFKFLEEISDVYYGILQKNNKLYKVGQYQTIKSIINIILFFIGLKVFNNFIFSVIFITVNNLLFVYIFERRNCKKSWPWELKIRKEEIFKLIKINFYICGYTFLSAYLVNSPKYAIDAHMNDEAQALFNMLIMPATFMFLVGGFIINPLIVGISEQFKKKNIESIKKVIKKIILILFSISLIVLGGTYLFGTKVLEIVYNLDFSKYKIHLLIVILGASFYTITAILGTILIAVRKIKIQFILSIICSIVAYILCNLFVIKYGMFGGFLSYLLVMVFRFICYIILIVYLFKNKKI